MKLCRLPLPTLLLRNLLARRKLGLNGITNRRRRRGLRRRLILVDLAPLHLFDRRAIAKPYSPCLRADLDDLEIIFLARLQRSRTLQRSRRSAVHGGSLISASFVFDFGVMAECLDVFAQLHERSERSDPRNFALHQLPDLVALEPIAPDIVDLLDAQRDSPVLWVNLQHFGCNRLALAENL